MDIRGLAWNPGNIEHIARHGVSPEEIEELLFGEELLVTHVGRRRYQAIGQTVAGRYLTVFLDHQGKGMFYPATARPCDAAERRLYHRLRAR